MKLLWYLLLAMPLLAQQDLVEALRSEQFPRALTLVEQQLKKEPSSARLWSMRGIILQRLRRPEDSVASFEKAMTMSPGYLPALQGAAQVAYEARLPAARSMLDRVLAAKPDDPTAHAMAGALAFERKDCETAISHFRAATPAIARSAPALAQFGECLLAAKSPAEAAAPLAEAHRIARDNDVVTYNLGLALYLAKAYDEGVAALRDIRKPDSGTLNLLAAVQAAAGDIQSAVASYRAAIAANPSDERNYLDLATLCLDHDSSDLAMEILNGGIQNLPRSAALHTMRGALRAQLGLPEQAQADFEKARELRPDELYGSVGLSLLWRESGRVDESIAIIRQKLEQTPHDPVLNYLLADSLAREGASPGQPEFAEAERALARAIAAKADFAKAHAAYGKLLLKGGKPERAVAELNEAVRYDPTDRTALNQLVLALRSTGRAEEAAAAGKRLKQALDDDRRAEVDRNRLQLVKRTSSSQ